ncbi:cyclic AMP-dependent transcription factor ATF-1 isoform X2 [Carettochelys insculpta]|uniref:cyclic AMP-dependent transcription factor ATF-1 isoform X2 n=1 Tax=Carettochelys insculpta TaxID=44489 RepID=UPI003EBC3B15
MEEVHTSTSNSSATPPQTTSIQGTALQAAHLSHISQQMSLRGSTPLTVVQLPGEQVQVQGVIQTAQSSVIHSPQVQTVQVSSLSESEDSQDSSDSIGSSQKAQGILARRPSYRKILKDLSSEDTRDRKGDDENPGVSTVTSMSVPTPIYQTSTGHCHCPKWSTAAGQFRYRWCTGFADVNNDKCWWHSAWDNNTAICTDIGWSADTCAKQSGGSADCSWRYADISDPHHSDDDFPPTDCCDDISCHSYVSDNQDR